MAGPRQPTRLVLAKGKKHFTKQEIVNPVAPLSYPTALQFRGGKAAWYE